MSSVYQRNGKGNYYYCGNDGRPRSMKTDDPVAAKMLQNKWDREELLSENGLINKEKTWAEFKQEYRAVYAAEHKPSSLVKLDIVIKGFERHINPGKMLGINSAKCELWRACRLNDGLQPRSVDAEQKYLAPMLRKAFQRGYMERDPFADIRRLRFSRPKPRALNVLEGGKLLLAVQEKLSDYLLLAEFFFNTGMRLGEALHQRIEDVDFFSGFINVQPHSKKCECHQCKRQETPGWTGKAGVPRKVPMTTRLQTLLLQRFQTQKTGCLFPHAERTVIKVFKKGFATMGISEKAATHIFRHTLATDMARAGIHDSVIAAILGHGARTTTDGYIHIPDEDLKTGMAQLEAWRNPEGGQNSVIQMKML